MSRARSRRRHARFKSVVKSWLATGSLRSAWLLNTSRRTSATLHVRGMPGTLRIRTGTSDAWHLRAALNSNFDLHEYRVPVDLAPEVILDIGANTGVVALSLHRAWPNARILAFEPMPENFDYLQHNVSGVSQIEPLPIGLGAARGEAVYYLSDDPCNFAGGTFHPVDDNLAHRHASLPIVPPGEFLEQRGIERVDLIKIDTEGAEHEILTHFPTDILARVSVIVGELHGVRDEALLEYLRRWFDIEHARVQGRLSFFKAVNRRLHDPTSAGAAVR